MPNRIIREGWLESPKIAQLTAQAERFFLRLCLRADDFGRFHGNPTILRNMLFPSCDNVTSKEVIKWVAECKDASLILFYRVKDSEYVEILNFNQRTRALVSKFPTYDGHMTVIGQTDDRHPRTYSETSAETSAETETSASPPAPAAQSTPDQAESIFALYPRRDGKSDALRSIKSAMKRRTPEFLLEAVQAYRAATDDWPAEERKYIPYAQKWFNKERYDDDRATWIYVHKDTTVPWQRPATTQEEHDKGF